MCEKKKACDKKSFTIYKITGNGFVYVGMTSQTLSTRFRQHKHDAKTEKCSISPKLCQKTPPPDLKALHRRLRDDSSKFRIEKIKTVAGSYWAAHSEELKVKSRLATVK